MKAEEMSQDGSASNSKKSKSRTHGGESQSGMGESGEQGSDDEGMSGSDMEGYGEEEESEDSDEIADIPSQNEMKRDLIQAIEEELREQEQLKKENEDL